MPTTYTRTISDTGLSVGGLLARKAVRTLSSAGLSVSDVLVRGPITLEYHVTLTLAAGLETSFLSEQLLVFLGQITPAHIGFSVGYTGGFLIGIDEIGIDDL